MRKILSPFPPPKDEPQPTPPPFAAGRAAWRGARIGATIYFTVTVLSFGHSWLFGRAEDWGGFALVFQWLSATPALFVANVLFGKGNWLAWRLLLPAAASMWVVTGAGVGLLLARLYVRPEDP